MMQGKARLSLFRNGAEVKRIEKKNTITAYPDNLLNEGNFHLMADRTKLMSINENFFKGCLLTDVENDPNLKMIAGNANVTAQCSNDAYSGDNLKRGSYNANESGVITGGYRHVFDWATSQGNGTIASVCLCRPSIGAVLLGTDSIPAEGAVNEVLNLTDYSSSLTEALASLTIVDYAKEVGYAIDYADSVITVTEYPMNTKNFHLLGGAFDVAGTGVVHSINQTVEGYATDRAFVAYTGSVIHLITFTANGTLNDYAISTSDWSVTAKAHTYSGVTFALIPRYSAAISHLRKDFMPLIGNYIYAVSNDRTKIYKCNLLSSNDADVTAYDMPAGSMASNELNGASVILPNGDWYKYPVGRPTNNSCLYCHDGRFYRATLNTDFLPSAGAGSSPLNSLNYTGFGSILALGGSSNFTYPFIRLDTVFPFVSTVANLESAVTKSADLTMKLTYEITEVAE